MRKKIEWLWEDLDECTKRAKVIGGWLVLRLGATDIEKGKNGKVVFRESMTFVADRDHEWEIAPAFDPSVPDKQHPKLNADDFKVK